MGITYDVYAIGWDIIVPRDMVLDKAASRTVFLNYHVAKGGFEPGYDVSSMILYNKVMKQKSSLILYFLGDFVLVMLMLICCLCYIDSLVCRK